MWQWEVRLLCDHVGLSCSSVLYVKKSQWKRTEGNYILLFGADFFLIVKDNSLTLSELWWLFRTNPASFFGTSSLTDTSPTASWSPPRSHQISGVSFEVNCRSVCLGSCRVNNTTQKPSKWFPLLSPHALSPLAHWKTYRHPTNTSIK